MTPIVLALACASPEQGGHPSPAHPSTGTSPDDTGTEPVDDTGPPFSSDDGGFVSIVVQRSSDGTTDLPTASATAQLYRELSPGVPGVVAATPAGPDTCAFTAYDVLDLSGEVPPTRDLESAGPLTLTDPSGAVSTIGLDPLGEYHLALDAEVVAAGGAWSVSAAGDTFPAFAAEDGLVVPTPWTWLSRPDPALATWSVELRWTGGDPGDLLVSLDSHDDAGRGVLILCDVVNDGEFLVPLGDGTIDAVPGEATVQVEQERVGELQVDDRRIRLVGAVEDVFPVRIL